MTNWVAAYRKKNSVAEEPLTMSERARELERANRELRMKAELWEKSGLLRESAAVKFASGHAAISGQKQWRVRAARTLPIGQCGLQ